VVPSPDTSLRLEWTREDQFIRLDVDLVRTQATLTCSADGADAAGVVAWHSKQEGGEGVEDVT
jgi:hypothetical protein